LLLSSCDLRSCRVSRSTFGGTGAATLAFSTAKLFC
jgi:hypothetical protein